MHASTSLACPVRMPRSKRLRLRRSRWRVGASRDGRPRAAVRSDRPGPASRHELGGLERPVAARFTPDGSALYVVDFGVVQMTDTGAVPMERSGKLWRISK